MSAADVRYGRRGGGWVPGDGASLADALEALRAANGGTLRTLPTGCDSEPADVQLGLDFGGDS
jgi:hypothetical protein